MNIRTWWQQATENKTRLIIVVLVGLVVFWLLRGCIPGLDSGLLPREVEDTVTRTYTTCISQDDTPIQYNEARQPECGRVDIRVVGEGRVPADAQAAGLTRAICYKVSIENPYWTTLATTRHEVKWKGRSVSKVTVLQNNAWQIFPDQDLLDEQRWTTFACPEPYESATGESPQNK